MKLLSKSFLAVLLLTVASVGWAACPEGTKNNYKGECVPTAESASTRINALLADSPYEELTNDVLNPDRGFYKQFEGRNKRFSISNVGSPDERFASTNAMAHFLHSHATVIKQYFIIDQYRNKDFDKAYLKRVEEYFAEAKTLGIKIIPRWTYHWPTPEEKKLKKEKKITATTASAEQMVRHIEQLGPILSKHKDAISFVEMGLIGFWGEWNGGRHGNKKNWRPGRGQVIKAWLENTSPDIYFALRYPTDRRHYSVWQLKGIERVGLHHDCPNYRADIYPKIGFVARDAPQGGEVCKHPPKTDYSCQTMIRYFERFQFDVLNGGDWAGSNRRFEKEGCLNEIRNRLGYRFVLLGSSYTDGKLTFVVKNKGFGKSFKNRKLSVKVGDQIIETKIDVKNWKPGTTYLESVDIGSVNSESVCLVIEDGIRFANTSGNEIILNDKGEGNCNPVDLDLAEYTLKTGDIDWCWNPDKNKDYRAIDGKCESAEHGPMTRAKAIGKIKRDTKEWCWNPDKKKIYRATDGECQSAEHGPMSSGKATRKKMLSR